MQYCFHLLFRDTIVLSSIDSVAHYEEHKQYYWCIVPDLVCIHSCRPILLDFLTLYNGKYCFHDLLISSKLCLNCLNIFKENVFLFNHVFNLSKRKNENISQSSLVSHADIRWLNNPHISECLHVNYSSEFEMKDTAILEGLFHILISSSILHIY